MRDRGHETCFQIHKNEIRFCRRESGTHGKLTSKDLHVKVVGDTAGVLVAAFEWHSCLCGRECLTFVDHVGSTSWHVAKDRTFTDVNLWVLHGRKFTLQSPFSWIE